MKTLETKRTILRNWKQEDAADIYAYASNPKVGPMAGWKPHETLEESKEILSLFIKEKETLAIELKSTHKVIGSVGLHHRTYAEFGEIVELGYVLSETHWGQGIMPEVVQAVLSYAQMLKSGKNDKFTDVFSKVLECYPLFMTTINDVHQGIPMECGLFDVVIIDEASQCDIAASLPVLLRGQRAVIVGDDKQLKSISFLDRRFNQLALVPLNNSRYSEHVAHLDNGKNSLYDFATYFADNNGIKMLREHFRCTSDNIYFSNKMFYGSKLIEDKNPSDPGELIFVKVQNAEATKKKACNYKEAVYIVNKIGYFHTLGI